MPGPHGPAIDPNWLKNGSASTIVSENYSRDSAGIDLVAALVTAVMTSVAMPFQAGDLFTSATFFSGATALSAGANGWIALYSTASTPALLGQSTDAVPTWAADVSKTFSLTTPYLIPSSGLYYVALMIKATTVPTLMGKGVNARLAINTGVTPQKALAQNSGSALTATAPATIATPTVQGALPYCVIT